MTNPDWLRASTFIGGSVTVGHRIHRDGLGKEYSVITLDHEDGVLEFEEDEVFNLIGALSLKVLDVRRARLAGH